MINFLVFTSDVQIVLFPKPDINNKSISLRKIKLKICKKICQL